MPGVGAPSSAWKSKIWIVSLPWGSLGSLSLMQMAGTNVGRTRRRSWSGIWAILVEIERIGDSDVIGKSKSAGLKQRCELRLTSEVTYPLLPVVIRHEIGNSIDVHPLGAGVVNDGLIGNGIDKPSAIQFSRLALCGYSRIRRNDFALDRTARYEYRSCMRLQHLPTFAGKRIEAAVAVECAKVRGAL